MRSLRNVAALAAFVAAQAEEATNERVVVRADRTPDVQSAAPFSVTAIDDEQLKRAPELRLDDILRAEVPGFSLFRRSSSRTANPTTQGVTLRNFGPSGAGRTLVLLDGIPLNDPFAGYVLWSQLPPRGIASVIVQSGGGAGLFGNEALAGTIFLTSRLLEQSTADGEISLGNEASYELATSGSVVEKPFAFGAFVERFSTAGYPVILARQRGPVDTSADSQSEVVGVRGEWQIARDTSLRIGGRWFDDYRNNGTRYTHNDSVGEDASAVLTQNLSEQHAQLQLAMYAQHRRFSSTFSSINDARTIETPALDQFNVPADALGGSAVWSLAAGDHLLTFGSDARSVSGETDELFSWNGTQFTRLRKAGGDQLFLGGFAQDVWSAASNLTIVGGLRYDHWDLSNGFRHESVRATGAVLTDSHFPDHGGDEINGRLGARFAASRDVSLRVAGYSGFRVPTLNELYRPFRLGNDVTEANPQLNPEHLLGGEAAVEWQATSALRVSATGFVNRLEDAVGNVTIGFGPGTFTPGGFIPRGGVLRERQNIDLVVAPGCELTTQWQIAPTLLLRANYLFTHPTIRRAADATLVGKLLAQTPEHVATGGVDWNATSRWSFTAQLRYTDRQFEDDLNSRVLAPYTTVDAATSYEISQRVSAMLSVENLFDVRIETGRSATDVISIGAPRLVSLRVRWQL